MALFFYNRARSTTAITSSSIVILAKLLHPLPRTFTSSPNAAPDSNSGPKPSCQTSSYSMMKDHMLTMDLSSQIGSCMPISMMRIGTLIHNMEMNPGQGGKLVRAAGTSAKILKDPRTSRHCLIRLPSGVEKLIDTQCRATIGSVGNPGHGAKKLRKAGQSRWLGRRPVVRGVAMNPIDHPHGGGEGKSKGRISSTPWGKPCKGGYKTVRVKRRN